MLRAIFLAGTCLAVLGACAQNMAAGEYWVDTDPGWGQGSPINGIPAQPDVSAQQFTAPTAGLAPGLHIVGIRTKDASGHWSLTNTTPVHVDAPLDGAEIVHTEYFWNSDSGWGTGTDASINGSPDIVDAVTASLSGTTPGMNNLFVRSKDINGHWSQTNSYPVYVDPPDTDAAIARTEYFWNTDPGWGQGSSTALAGQSEVNNAVAASSADVVTGLNNLFVRSMDTHGHWSLTNAVPLYAEASPSGRS
ncbi:MAG: hypothetical protein IPJ85_05905 [Flavobacteriales bacterium]|nr:hypothetical protein [Flavobacteriales bacterium]